MTRRTWEQLADGVRHAIEAQCGPVSYVTDAPAGSVCDFAATLETADGTVFCKAVHEDSDTAWMLGNEARVNPWLPDMAPRLLWHIHTGAWLVNGYEHIDGRHADLTPGSPDLPAVAAAMAEVSECDTADWATPVQPIEDRWATYTTTARHLVGIALVHTDPVAANLLVANNRVRVVDWAWPARGAPWIDTALLVIRLIDAGHTPVDAEHWATNVPAWSKADSTAVTEFAGSIAGMWHDRARDRPAPHRDRLAAVAADWAHHRTIPAS